MQMSHCLRGLCLLSNPTTSSVMSLFCYKIAILKNNFDICILKPMIERQFLVQFSSSAEARSGGLCSFPNLCKSYCCFMVFYCCLKPCLTYYWEISSEIILLNKGLNFFLRVTVCINLYALKTLYLGEKHHYC